MSQQSSQIEAARNIAELRALARRRLPRGIFESMDRGSEDEVALCGNEASFRRLKLRPRTMVDISKRSQSVTLFGQRLSTPMIVAPTGAGGLFWKDGERLLARAAAAAGAPFGLSTASMISMEAAAQEIGPENVWFQLYIYRQRELASHMVDRAQACGITTLILTVDTPVPPNREYNFHNGFELPFRLSSANLTDILIHPRWFWGVLMSYLVSGGLPRFENFPSRAGINNGVKPQHRPGSPTWRDFDELRASWKGHLIVKGILTGQDASIAVDHGADAVIVSNHGGRNLDAAPATIDVLEEVCAAVQGRAPVLLDSGIRRGSDVVKAMALGASAVLVGRAPLYGLSAGGEAGASRALSLLREEIDRTLAFIGCPDINQLRASFILQGPTL